LDYQVIQAFEGFELRSYPEHLLVTVQVTGDFVSAGNSAFGSLLGYITGANTDQSRIAMTSPVIQRSTEDGLNAVSFVLPSKLAQSGAPTPLSQGLTVNRVKPQLMVAKRFSGRWSSKRFEAEAAELRGLVEHAVSIGLLGGKVTGTPMIARYDPPFKPYFLRRNEVLFQFDPEQLS
jgi:hypothetical protein